MSNAVSYLSRGSHSRGCRTRAWAKAQATADSARADKAVPAVCRRRVCGAAEAAGAGAAPQHVELQKAPEWPGGAPGPAALHEMDSDLEAPGRTNDVAWTPLPPYLAKRKK